MVVVARVMAARRATSMQRQPLVSRASSLAVVVVVAASFIGGCGDGGAMPDAGSATDAAAQGSCTPVKPSSVDPGAIAAGMALVKANKCQQCHGTAMSGNFDGVLFPGHSMPAYPPNLTPDADTGLGCWTDAQIANAILNGSDNQGQPICPPMPHFSNRGLTQADAQSIIAFLRSLPPASNQVPDTPSCQPWGTLGGGCDGNGDCPAGAVCSFQFCVTDDGTGGGSDGGNKK